MGKNLPKNFPVIDDFCKKTGTATSIKSMDLKAASYQKPSTMKSKIKGYINKVAKFTEGELANDEVKSGTVKKRVLKLAIPKEATSAQSAVLEEVKRYAESIDVLLKIIKIK